MHSSRLWPIINEVQKVTRKEASNNFDQERLEHPVSPKVSPPAAYPATAPVLSHGHPGSSIMTDGQREGPFTDGQAHHGAGKKFIKGGQCTYFVTTCSDC